MALFVLAVWCAECAWGGFTVAAYPVVLLFLGPLYGGAALLIREVARRRGAGWPGIVLLAAAFGVFQAALVDQSLLDPGALSGTEFAAWNEAASATRVFGVSAEQAFDFVGGHVWLSICAPIALVEACVAPAERDRAWLGRGVWVTLLVVYAGSSVLIWSDSGRVVSPAQAVVVLGVCGLLVTAALLLPRRRDAVVPAGGGVPPVVLGVVVAGAQVASWFFGSQWWGVGLRVVTLLVVAVLLARFAVSPRHVVAALGACVLVAAVAAWLSPPYEAAAPWLMLLSDAAVTVVALVVVTVAYHRVASGGGSAS
ncbi:hypothetical protein [Actinoplanes sp. OR16]|uniref:hypothetical protein n=1 Tax=Actinoplanes sp. OR16 TaxID=946334 RepID=UPI000FD7CCB4|nr:hypothetical protein [Actinoplanes sp. OR16]